MRSASSYSNESFLGATLGGCCLLFLCLALSLASVGQVVRSDAFPAAAEPQPKGLSMATSVEAMAGWARYPTFGVYQSLMEGWARRYGTLCRLDTLGFSVEGRPILCLAMGNAAGRQVFYSSAMHGDELVGFVLLLRLADSLLSSYSALGGSLLDTLQLFIAPLLNPDGCYAGGDNTVGRAQRENANLVDLNRNFPNPFAEDDVSMQPENECLVRYIEEHAFALSAHLHCGAEVLNFPWDSFCSDELCSPHIEWWRSACARIVGRSRLLYDNFMTDVCADGYIPGGDWYVITNGRQDWLNYHYGLRDLTMEISVSKMPPASSLPRLWDRNKTLLYDYIRLAYGLPAATVKTTAYVLPFPNPASTRVYIPAASGLRCYDVRCLPRGVHVIECEGIPYKIVKY